MAKTDRLPTVRSAQAPMKIHEFTNKLPLVTLTEKTTYIHAVIISYTAQTGAMANP
jgi:hypothetical protein